MESEVKNNLVFKTIRSKVLKVTQRTEISFEAKAQGGGGSIQGATYGHMNSGTGSTSGYVSGYIAPIDFTHSGGSLTVHEYWLNDDDGTEFILELLQTNIRAREGNTFSIVYVGRGDDGKGFVPLVVLNHDTKQYQIFMNSTKYTLERHGYDIALRKEQIPYLVTGFGIAGIVTSIGMKKWWLVIVALIIGTGLKGWLYRRHKIKVDEHNQMVISVRSKIDKIFNEKVDELLAESGLNRLG